MSYVTGQNLLQSVLTKLNVTMLPSQQSYYAAALQEVIDNGQDSPYSLAYVLSTSQAIMDALLPEGLPYIVKDAMDEINANMPGMDFILTTGTDIFDGSEFADEFKSNQNTLQSDDELDGKEGNDVLYVTMNAHNSSVIAAPTLVSIEKIIVRGANMENPNIEIDLSNSEGYQVLESSEVSKYTQQVGPSGLVAFYDIQNANDTYLRIIDTGVDHMYTFDVDSFLSEGGEDDNAYLYLQEVGKFDYEDGPTVTFENEAPAGPSFIDNIHIMSDFWEGITADDGNYLQALQVGNELKNVYIEGTADLEIEDRLDRYITYVQAHDPNSDPLVGLDADLTIDLWAQGLEFTGFGDQVDGALTPVLTVYGALGDDNIDIGGPGEYGGFNYVDLSTGDDDLVVGDVEHLWSHTTVVAGEGDDKVKLNMDGLADVDLGAGHDTLKIYGDVDDLTTVDPSGYRDYDGTSFIFGKEGDDNVMIEGSGDYFVDLGADNDNLFVNVHAHAGISTQSSMSAGDYTILSGGGDDMHLLFTDGQVDAVLGDGNDIIGVVSGEGPNHHDIDGGNGEDLIGIVGNGNQTVDSGADDDVVLIGTDNAAMLMVSDKVYEWYLNNQAWLVDTHGPQFDFATEGQFMAWYETFVSDHGFELMSHGVHDITLGGGADYLLINGERDYPGNIDPGPPFQPTLVDAGDGPDTVDIRFDHILGVNLGAGPDELILRARDLTIQDTVLGGQGIDTLVLTNQGGTKTNGFVGESETYNTNQFEIFDLRDSNINFSLTNAMFASAFNNNIIVTTENAEVSLDLPSLTLLNGTTVSPFSSGMLRANYDTVINNIIAGKYVEFPKPYLNLAINDRYPEAFADLEAWLLAQGIQEVDYSDSDGDTVDSSPWDEVYFRFDSDLQQTVDMTAMTSPPNSFTLLGGSIKDVVIGNDMTVNWNSFLRFDAPGQANSTDDTLVLDGSQTQIAASDLNVVGLERIKLQDDANNAKDWFIELNARVINQTTGDATLYIDADTEVPAGSNLYITLDPDVHDTSTNNVVIIRNANLNVFITDPANGLNEYQVKDAELFGGRDFDTGTYSITVVEGIPGGGTYYFTTNSDRLTGSGLDDLFVAQTLDQVQSGDMVYGQDGFDTVQFKFPVSNELTTLQDQIENAGFTSIERVEFDTVLPVSMFGIDFFDFYLPDLEELATGDGSDDLRNMRQNVVNTWNSQTVQGILYELNDGDDTISLAPDFPFGNSAVTTVDGGPGYDEVILPGMTWDELAIISVEEVNGLGTGTQDEVYILDNDQNGDGINDSDAPDDLVKFFGIRQIFASNNADNIEADSNGGPILLYGFDGNDTINVGTNTPTDAAVFGGSGDDLINVAATNDILVSGDGGNDTISANAGDDVAVFGGSGDDSINVIAGDDAFVSGDDGNDEIDVLAAEDAAVAGGQGNDDILVDVGNDALVFGNDGEDTIDVNAFDDAIVFGGDGNDDITVVAASATWNNVFISGGSGNDTIDATVDDFSYILGGNGDDEITLTGAGPILPNMVISYINGGPGNDLIDITANNDGSDTIELGALFYDDLQNQWINNQGMDTINGFNFEDWDFTVDPAPINEDFLILNDFLLTFPGNPLSVDNLVTFTGDWDGSQTIVANTDTGPSIVVVSSQGAPDLLPANISVNQPGTIQLNDNDRAVVVVGKNATGIGSGIDEFDVYYVVDTDSSAGSQNWTVEKVAEINALTKVGVEAVMDNLTLGLYVNDAPVINIDSATGAGFTLETSDPNGDDVWWVTAPFGPTQLTNPTPDPDLFNFATSEQGSLTWSQIIGVDGVGGLSYDTNYTLVMGTAAGNDIVNVPAFVDRNYLLYGFGGDDVLRGNDGGPDYMFGGDDNDKFVVVGTIGTDYVGYTGGTVQLDADLATAGIDGVINAFELQTPTADSEVVAGTVIDGEAGTDELHAFGTVNLSLINGGGPLDVESLNIWSNITLTQAQLSALETIVLEGEEPHSITITDLPDGMTQEQAFEAWLDQPEQQLLTNGDEVQVGDTVYGATDIAAFDGETHTFDVGASGQDLDAGLEDSYRVEFSGEFADNNDNFIRNFANGDSADDDVLDFGTNFAGTFTGIEADGSFFDGAITPFDDDGGNPAGDGLDIGGNLVLVKGYGFDFFDGENKTEIVDVFEGTGSSGDVFDLSYDEAILFASYGSFTPGENVYMWYVNETGGDGVQESEVHLIGIVEESTDAELFWHADNFLGV